MRLRWSDDAVIDLEPIAASYLPSLNSLQCSENRTDQANAELHRHCVAYLHTGGY